MFFLREMDDLESPGGILSGGRRCRRTAVTTVTAGAPPPPPDPVHLHFAPRLLGPAGSFRRGSASASLCGLDSLDSVGSQLCPLLGTCVLTVAWGASARFLHWEVGETSAPPCLPRSVLPRTGFPVTGGSCGTRLLQQWLCSCLASASPPTFPSSPRCCLLVRMCACVCCQCGLVNSGSIQWVTIPHCVWVLMLAAGGPSRLGSLLCC